MIGVGGWTRRGFIFGLGAFGLVGCAGSIMSPTRGLRESVMAFNDHLRWNRYRQAAEAIPNRYRETWIQRQEQAAKTLRITEYEVRPVNGIQEHAWVDVDVAFHRTSDFTVHNVRRRQEWRVIEGQWMIVSEREVPREREPEPREMPTYDFNAGLAAPDR